MENKVLSELRLRIDEVDEKMLKLLLERIEIASQIGEFKKNFALPIIDSDRKKNVLAKRLEFARKIGLSEAEAGELFEFLHTIAVKTQEKIKNL